MAFSRSCTSWVRWFTLALLLASALGLSYLALLDDWEYVSNPSKIKTLDIKVYSFSWREWASLITPAAAGVLALIFHILDKRFMGGGIGHRVNIVRKLTSRSYDLTPGAIAATMTKQSVLIAIAAILLGIVQVYHGDGRLTPSGKSEFKILTSRMSMLGFLLSIVLLLVSLKCYDYASRFNLKDVYKAELVRKGLRLDIWSWYLILFSLVIGVASLNTAISITVSFVVGYLLWWYYFIHPQSENRSERRHQRKTPNPYEAPGRQGEDVP